MFDICNLYIEMLRRPSQPKFETWRASRSLTSTVVVVLKCSPTIHSTSSSVLHNAHRQWYQYYRLVLRDLLNCVPARCIFFRENNHKKGEFTYEKPWKWRFRKDSGKMMLRMLELVQYLLSMEMTFHWNAWFFGKKILVLYTVLDIVQRTSRT